MNKPERIPKRVFLSLAKELCSKTKLSELTEAEKHIIAVALYQRSYVHSCSSFEDIITYGYGSLDDYGFWEYPLYEEDLVSGLNKLRILERQKEALNGK
jgi:hypothetical protein